MKIDFTETGWRDYLYWQGQYGLSGLWSRRIDDGNRLVYRIIDDRIEVLQCRGHYSDTKKA
jgi:toxin YoeB